MSNILEARLVENPREMEIKQLDVLQARTVERGERGDAEGGLEEISGRRPF